MGPLLPSHRWLSQSCESPLHTTSPTWWGGGDPGWGFQLILG